MRRPLPFLAAGAVVLIVAAAAAPAARAQSGPTLKVMDWNIHHGVDTSNANNLERVVNWIVQVNPHVVSLNEVEKKNGYNGGADEPEVLESLLETRTGVEWYGCFAHRSGGTNGQGNLLLSRIPFESCDRTVLSAQRSAARGTLRVGGVLVAVLSTHLDDASATTRTTQVKELLAFASSGPANRILMGDFNASATSTELAPLRAAWDDAWAVAVSEGTAVSYPANPKGNTRNSRIDYIWRSKDASELDLLGAQVYDTGTVSDHRPLSATYLLPTTIPTPVAPRNVRVVDR